MSFSKSEPQPARHKAPLKENEACPDRRLVPPSEKRLETKGSLGLCLQLLSARTKQSCLTVQAISSTLVLEEKVMIGGSSGKDGSGGKQADRPPKKHIPIQARQPGHQPPAFHRQQQGWVIPQT